MIFEGRDPLDDKPRLECGVFGVFGVDDASGLVQSFDLPIEYYNGVDDGESWSEGGQEKEEFYSAVPEGNYALRLEVQRGNFSVAMPLLQLPEA